MTGSTADTHSFGKGTTYGVILALDITFEAGGLTSVNGANKGDRQNNMRIGGTFLLPVGQQHLPKFSCSTDAVVRMGANFTMLSIGWQTILV